MCEKHAFNNSFHEKRQHPAWKVPLVDPTELDMAELRGRRVKDIRFGQFSHQLHIWVDASGQRRS